MCARENAGKGGARGGKGGIFLYFLLFPLEKTTNKFKLLKVDGYIIRACSLLLRALSLVKTATEEEFPDREVYINVIEELVDEIVTMDTAIEAETTSKEV